MLMSLSTLL
jgi:hypothetical protein